MPRVLAQWPLRIFLIAAAALSLTAASAPAQSPPTSTDTKAYPDTPAGTRARELLEIFNTGDSERVRAYIRESFAPEFRDRIPLDDHAAIFRRHYQLSGGYDFYGTRTYDPPRPETTCVVIVTNRTTEAWEAITVDVEPEAPHRVAAMRLGPARPPADAAEEGPLSREEAVKTFDAWLDRLAKKGAISGTVLLAKDGEVVYTRAYGEASKEWHIPNNVSTRFNLGSMNKMFTAVAIAQLVERGKVSYEDPIGKYVDESWLPREITDRVQVRHLLTHTSGLGSYFNEEFVRSSRELFRRVEDYKPLVKGETLRFTPGTDWAYSNTGFLIAGVVIEKASGQDYFDYIREHVYAPAGMTSTDSYEMDRMPENLAIGYSREVGPGGEPVWVNNLYRHVIKGGPAGGGFSTVEDLLRFDRAMRSGRLVSPATAEVLWSAKPEIGSSSYGYGFRAESTRLGRVTGHSGGFAGINADLHMYLDSGWTLAAMSNYDNGATLVVRKATELIQRIQ